VQLILRKKNNATQEERIKALILENRGLKEILAVHEHMHQHKQLPTTISESTNAESSVAQSSSLPVTSEVNTTISSQQEVSS